MRMFGTSTILAALLTAGLVGCRVEEDSTSETGAGMVTNAVDSTGDPTGGSQSHRVCELYLDCLAVVAPTELPNAQQGFGPDGTCWQGSDDSAEQCLMACKTGLETWHEQDPSEPACGLCQETSDCPDELVCKDGECQDATVLLCGDGKVDPSEACDGGQGCDADCQGPTCSPLTQVGCADGDVCLYNLGGVQCIPEDTELPGLGEACDNFLCGPKLFCTQCESSSCCAALCDVNIPGACPTGFVCDPLSIGEPLDYIGVCFET